MVKKIGDKSCQSNSDKGASDFGSFLVIYLLRPFSQQLKNLTDHQMKYVCNF